MKRDRYDWGMMIIQAVGATAVVVAIVVTLWINSQNSTDTKTALTRLSQMATAETDASLAEQTPHVRLWARHLNGFDKNQELEGSVRIKDAARVTIYDGKVSMGMGITHRNNIDAVWSNLTSLPEGSTVVLGPDDEQTFTMGFRKLRPEERAAIIRGEMVFVVAGAIDFTDVAHRPHHRSICSMFYYLGNRMTVDNCPNTQKQS
jgi:hypothetical protein